MRFLAAIFISDSLGLPHRTRASRLRGVSAPGPRLALRLFMCSKGELETVRLAPCPRLFSFSRSDSPCCRSGLDSGAEINTPRAETHSWDAQQRKKTTTTKQEQCLADKRQSVGPLPYGSEDKAGKNLLSLHRDGLESSVMVQVQRHGRTCSSRRKQENNSSNSNS